MPALPNASRTSLEQHTGLTPRDLELIRGAAVRHATIEQLPLPYFFDVINNNTLSDSALREHIERVGVAIYQKEA